LAEGDAIAVAGVLTPKVWLDKQGNAKPALDMIVSRVLTADPLSPCHDDSRTSFSTFRD
jgi:hypothetical protein